MIISESKKAMQTLHIIKLVLFELKSYFILRNICIFRYKVHYNIQGKYRLCTKQISSLYKANVVFVQGKCCLCTRQMLSLYKANVVFVQGKFCLCTRQMSSLYKANVVFVLFQTLFFHNVQKHLFLQSINDTNRRKTKFVHKWMC